MRTSCTRIITSIFILSIFEVTVIRSQEVYFTPVVSADGKEISGCRPFAISFINSGATNLTYFWNFMDGSPICQAFSPKHVFSTSGIFKVERITYDSLLHFIDTAIITVTISPVPRCEFVIVDRPYFAMYDSIITVNVSTGASKFYWTLNEEKIPTDKLQFLPATPGKYEIALIAENSFGCRDTIVREIAILPSPFSLFEPDQLVSKENLETVIKNLSITWARYARDFGDDNITSELSPVHTYPKSGTYHFTRSAINRNGCPDDLCSVVMKALGTR